MAGGDDGGALIAADSVIALATVGEEALWHEIVNRTGSAFWSNARKLSGMATRRRIVMSCRCSPAG